MTASATPTEHAPKVLLVQAGTAAQEYPFRSHPLGLLYLASSIQRRFPRADIRVADMKVQPHTEQSIAALCRELGPDLVGVGAFSVHADIFNDVVRAVRDAAPQALIVGGGPHASCHPERVLREAPVDAAVAGEGESVLPALLDAHLHGRAVSGIPGAAILENGCFSANPPPDIPHPDELPFPAWDLINIEDYTRVSSFCIMGRRRYMSLFTSRGCPFQCIYCHRIFGKQFRPRSADNVLAEMREIIQRFGITDFDILDDAFNLDKERVHAICEGVLEFDRPVMMTFPNGLRSDLLDDDTLRLMRRAGTRYISFAIESATPRLQKLMRKNLDLSKAERAIRTAARLGIFCNGFFMLGFPSETEPELRDTVDFAVHSPLHTAHFLKVTPFEGTPMFEMMSQEMQQRAAHVSDALKYYDRSFNLSDVDNKQFNRILAAAHRRFYINPVRLLRMAAAHPRRINLLRFALFALRRIVFASSRGD